MQTNLEQEIWKSVPNYEGYYEASNLGRVRSIDRIVPSKRWGSRSLKGVVLNFKDTKLGYSSVHLKKFGAGKWHMTHRLVMLAFTGSEKQHLQVNHINGIKTDNRLENLEWCTGSQNILHAYKNGLKTFDANHLKKKVVQRQKDGTFIKEWDNMRLAAKSIGANVSNISQCCIDNRKTAKGFRWQYA